MAPQQNSTFIENNLIGCSSLTNLPEELNRCSPILPPKSEEDKININKYIENKENNNRKHTKEQQQIQRKCSQQHKTKHYRNGSNHGGRSRSISLSGVYSNADPGKEIPIWIGEEPRYVSGVTNKTTCNDIIRALIDDEVQNGNIAYCKHSKDGGVAAESRDYSDYVIAESWRGIERSYDGNMAILPVWKAWSRVHNELRLFLKCYKDIQEPIEKRKGIKCFSAFFKDLTKLFPFFKRNKIYTDKNNTKTKYLNNLLSTKCQIPDELLFIILPDTQYILQDPEINEKEREIVNKYKSLQQKTATFMEKKCFKEKLYTLAERRKSTHRRSVSLKRKKHTKIKENRSSISTNSKRCINRQKKGFHYSSIRNQLAEKTAKINELYDREYTLTKQLSNKCRLYRLQNALYTDPKHHLDISIGQIQTSIETCAQEIIHTEHELLELKNIIKDDISIINNLKRMTLERKDDDCNILKPGGCKMNSKGTSRTKTYQLNKNINMEKAEQMQFVDNIYEFCDNNASMLV